MLLDIGFLIFCFLASVWSEPLSGHVCLSVTHASFMFLFSVSVFFYVFFFICIVYISKQSVYILFRRYKLFMLVQSTAYNLLSLIYLLFIIVLCISLFCWKIPVFIEHNSYWTATFFSTSVTLRFRVRELCKHNKQDFNSAWHSFDLIQCIITDLWMLRFSARS